MLRDPSAKVLKIHKFVTDRNIGAKKYKPNEKSQNTLFKKRSN